MICTLFFILQMWQLSDKGQTDKHTTSSVFILSHQHTHSSTLMNTYIGVSLCAHTHSVSVL